MIKEHCINHRTKKNATRQQELILEKRKDLQGKSMLKDKLINGLEWSIEVKGKIKFKELLAIQKEYKLYEEHN
jgi:hypothetical protein